MPKVFFILNIFQNVGFALFCFNEMPFVFQNNYVF